jgi:hypothetical protein
VALPPAWYAANSLAHEATLRQRLLCGKRADEKMKPEELNDGSRDPELTNSQLEGRSLRFLACHNSIALLESIEDVPAFRFVQNVVQYATSSEVQRMDTLARMQISDQQHRRLAQAFSRGSRRARSHSGVLVSCPANASGIGHPSLPMESFQSPFSCAW